MTGGEHTASTISRARPVFFLFPGRRLVFFCVSGAVADGVSVASLKLWKLCVCVCRIHRDMTGPGLSVCVCAYFYDAFVANVPLGTKGSAFRLQGGVGDLAH